MRHLDQSELVDSIEGQLEPSRAEHLDECDACRTQAAMLRSALAEVHLDERHEPSPLFWDHFAARVSDAIRVEAPPSAGVPGWLAWLRSPATAWATSASIAMLLMVTALCRGGSRVGGGAHGNRRPRVGRRRRGRHHRAPRVR